MAGIARPPAWRRGSPGQGPPCGVCRTDLHVFDGDLPDPKSPIIPGHEIVGRIDAIGPGGSGLAVGERVGVPWLGDTCGVCPYCAANREKLCDAPRFTGYTRDGGFKFLGLVPHMGIEVKTTTYPLQQANQALEDLRAESSFDGIFCPCRIAVIYSGVTKR